MAESKTDKNQTQNKNPFSIMEEDVLDFWEKGETFKRSVEKEAPNGDYVFYDGPPFITGLPHYATLLPSIAKDVIPRYWTMKGYRVERVWGWDCHGLPAENKVEKELGLRNKNDIEELGVGKFVDACRKYVDTGSEQWEWYINRIARWVDMKNSYKTMDLKFMESVIWAFKELFKKDLIYEGYRTSLHCPRCATPLSKFEITMDAGSYKDVEDETVIVKFKLNSNSAERIANNGEDAYVLAWTTTPWTLPGNLALAVGENIKYFVLSVKGESGNYILAKDKTEDVMAGKDFNIVKELVGKDIIGLEYEPVFDLGNEKITNDDKTHKVYAGDFVTTEEGTGIVHIAPNFGEDDFNLGQSVGLPMIDLMDESGVYSEEAGPWQGEYFKKANTRALSELGEKLFSQAKHTHSYPFCYRCNTRLIHKTQKAWYLKISEIRQKMLDTNKDINWVPEYFKEGRFQYNLENAPDWCLSRSRYWGSPIPVWRCEVCGELKVFGSIDEIEKTSGKKVDDLHRPAIDEVDFDCDCGGKMKRVKEVLDCWFESGSMPFAQFHYPFERKEEFKNLLPADFIIEYTGQLRGWFYYLHVLANALFDDRAFKNVIVSGVLAGTDGRKMSKSYGNYPDPKETLHKYGADALRMYFMGSSIMMGGDTSLNEKDIQDSLRKNVMILWNVVKFYKMFAIDQREADIENMPVSENVLDKWILARLNVLIKEVTEGLEKYDMPSTTRPVQAFIDDLSTWYVRRSRDRFKGEDEKDKNFALKTTGYILLQLSKTVAPLMPFMAEQVWQAVTGNNFENNEKSVHLVEWPLLDENKNITEESDVLIKMGLVRKLAEVGLAKRDEFNIKVRQPLNSFTVKTKDTELIQLKDETEYLEILKDELNVKNIIFKKVDEDVVEYVLDTEITEELSQECIKREFVRFVNAMRKNAGLSINDRVDIRWDGTDLVKSAVDKFKADILKDTLSDEITLGLGDSLNKKEVKVNGEDITLEIIKK